MLKISETMEILKTARLTLRTWSLDNAESAFQIYGDPAVMQYVDAGLPMSLEAVTRSLLTGMQHQETYGCQHWAVIENETGRVVGACGFSKYSEFGEYELVFHFAKSSWGKGFATEAARGAIEYAFQNLGALRLVAGSHPKNDVSKRVLSKLDFSDLGLKWFGDTQSEEPFFELRKSAFRLC